MRSEGVFTPPSFEGTVIRPGAAGGSNWGSVAYDPDRRLLFANTSNVANTIQLVRREQASFERDREAYVGRAEQNAHDTRRQRRCLRAAGAEARSPLRAPARRLQPMLPRRRVHRAAVPASSPASSASPAAVSAGTLKASGKKIAKGSSAAA